MKKITVYGPGCMKCQKTEAIVRQVVAEMKVEAAIEQRREFARLAGIVRRRHDPRAGNEPKDHHGYLAQLCAAGKPPRLIRS